MDFITAYKEGGIVLLLMTVVAVLGKWLRDTISERKADAQERLASEHQRAEALAARLDAILIERATEWTRRDEEAQAQVQSLTARLAELQKERDELFQRVVGGGQ